MAATRTGIRVRKLAGEDGPDAVYHHDHQTGEPSARPFGGVVFLDEKLRRGGTPPKHIRLRMQYATREPWIEVINQRPVFKPGGPAEDPYRVTHTFAHADELVLHTLDGDYRYRVVGQPDKYDAKGHPTDVTGDPTTEVRWFFDADLIKED